MIAALILSGIVASCDAPKTIEVYSMVPEVGEAQEIEIEAYIELVGGKYANKLKAMAYCESTMNEKAVSKGGTYIGLYQWYPQSWEYYGCRGDIWDGKDQVDCTLRMLREGRASMWPLCQHAN